MATIVVIFASAFVLLSAIAGYAFTAYINYAEQAKNGISKMFILGMIAEITMVCLIGFVSRSIYHKYLVDTAPGWMWSIILIIPIVALRFWYIKPRALRMT